MHEAFRVFNMGIGFVIVCDEHQAQALQESAPGLIEIGRIQEREGDASVELVGLNH